MGSQNNNNGEPSSFFSFSLLHVMGDFEGKFAAAIHGPVNSDLLAHVSQQAARVIPCHPGTSATQQSQAWPPPLRTFISVIVKRSAVRAGTLFAALVFLERLQRRLQSVARGMPCTCHRIFLATLIVTSKALHDASPKNKHWAKYAMWCFSIAEINLMEKQLLTILVRKMGYCFVTLLAKC